MVRWIPTFHVIRIYFSIDNPKLIIPDLKPRKIKPCLCLFCPAIGCQHLYLPIRNNLGAGSQVYIQIPGLRGVHVTLQEIRPYLYSMVQVCPTYDVLWLTQVLSFMRFHFLSILVPVLLVFLLYKWQTGWHRNKGNNILHNNHVQY